MNRILLVVLGAASLLTAGYAHAQENEQAPVPDETIADTREVQLTPIRVPGIERPLTVVEFEAPSVDRMMKYIALLPEGYDDSEEHYPVLYLLHGFAQNYTVFPRMGVPQYTADKDLIVIMPDAGNSWYINWADSAEDELNNWADYITYDLVENVDAVFRTIPRRAARAISGVSMGGYGAITLALRRPDLFISVASHSGTLKYARTIWNRLEAGEDPEPNAVPAPSEDEESDQIPEIIAIEDFTYQHERYPEGVAFTNAAQAKAYDPFELISVVPSQHLPHLYIDCATGDSLIEDAREFAQVLMENDIPFTFAQSPGGHGVRYWTRELAQSIAVQYSIMRSMLLRIPDPLSIPSTDRPRSGDLAPDTP